jgi:hypothetical protein
MDIEFNEDDMGFNWPAPPANRTTQPVVKPFDVETVRVTTPQTRFSKAFADAVKGQTIPVLSVSLKKDRSVASIDIDTDSEIARKLKALAEKEGLTLRFAHINDIPSVNQNPDGNTAVAFVGRHPVIPGRWTFSSKPVFTHNQ